MIHDIAQAVVTAQPADAATLGQGAPTNQEIVDHAKQAYAAFQSCVDASALALTNIIKTGSLTEAITALDGTNWQSGGITEKVVNPIFAAPDVQSAIAAAAFPVKTYSVGAFSNDLPGGAVGVIGFARSLAGQGSSLMTLSIDLYKHAVRTDNGRNLQLGQWLKDPADLHDQVYGLYIQTTIQGVTTDLKIVLDTSLSPYGFVESTGATLQLPVTSSPFGGATSIT